MPTSRDLEYQARYQRDRRAKARAAGLSHLNAAVPADLVDRLDRMKQARGLSNRDAALATVLREFFGDDPEERKPAVST